MSGCKDGDLTSWNRGGLAVMTCNSNPEFLVSMKNENVRMQSW